MAYVIIRCINSPKRFEKYFLSPLNPGISLLFSEQTLIGVRKKLATDHLRVYPQSNVAGCCAGVFNFQRGFYFFCYYELIFYQYYLSTTYVVSIPTIAIFPIFIPCHNLKGCTNYNVAAVAQSSATILWLLYYYYSNNFHFWKFQYQNSEGLIEKTLSSERCYTRHCCHN